MEDIKNEKKELKKIHPLANGISGHSDCKKTGKCKTCKERGCNICLNKEVYYSALPIVKFYCDNCFSKRIKSK